MDWPSDRQWFALAVILYGVCMLYSALVWRRGFRRDRWVVTLVLALAFLPHTIALLSRSHSLGEFPVTSLYGATLFVLWTMTATSLLLDLWPRLSFSGAFASPLLFAVGVFALTPGLDRPSDQLTNGIIRIHAALILLSYGAFGLSAIAGVMFLSQEHDLKFNKLRAIVSRLPSIQRLDRIGSFLMIFGAVLLTIGLGLTPWLYRDPESAFEWDAKILWSGLVWLIYAAMAAARWRWRFQGHRFAMGTVCAFAFLLLTFWGTNLLSGIHHPPPRKSIPIEAAGN